VRIRFGSIQCAAMSPLTLDGRLLLLARTRGHARWAERAIGAFSRTGEHAAIWLGLGAVGYATSSDPNRRAAWARGIKIVAASYAVNYAVKVAVRRPRPDLPQLPPLTPTVSRLSFPSAHATTSFAAAHAYGDLLPPGVLYAAALAFALSRPYLGVHYPADVLAGALLGTATAEVWPS
jgi:membrane-associated phospholipid phosphatase